MPGGVTPQHREDLRRYRPSREFYLPSWDQAEAPEHALVADFLRPCAMDKRAVGSAARVVARLSRRGWLLLNACLVRFQARDDGRFD